MLKVKNAVLLVFFGSVVLVAMAQNIDHFTVNIKQHITGEGDDVFYAKNILYVPERDSNTLKFYLLKYNLASGKKIGEYHPPKEYENAPGFAIDGDDIYIHQNDLITKISMSKNLVVWQHEYESGFAAQIAPEIMGNYVGVALDDLILLLDKNTGKLVLKKEGEDFDQGISVVDDYFFYGYFENETLVAHNLKLGKDIWQLNVGGDPAVFAPIIENDIMYVPSSRANSYAVNKNTGKKIWTMEAGEELMNSCGSGFNGQPVLVGDTLYNLQRETGLWIIDKNTGKVADTIDFYESVNWQIHQYKNSFLIVGDEYIYSFNPANREIKELVALPENDSCYPTISFTGTHLILDYIGCYDSAPKVDVYNIESYIND